jgi:hypothetical protein
VVEQAWGEFIFIIVTSLQGIDQQSVGEAAGGWVTVHGLQHLEKYKGFLVLALAAYNAGDSNANEWIKLFGDPRETGDWLNWIESISFGETRNYIHRVLENAAVYAALFIPSEHYETIDWITKPVPHKNHH